MCVQPGLGQRLDQADLVGGGDRPGLDLEALARAFLVDFDVLGRSVMGALRWRDLAARVARRGGLAPGGAVAADSTRATLPRPAPPGTRRASQEETKR